METTELCPYRKLVGLTPLWCILIPISPHKPFDFSYIKIDFISFHFMYMYGRWVKYGVTILILFSNCKSHVLSFQVSKLEPRYKRCIMKFLILCKWSHRLSQLCSLLNLWLCLYFEPIIQSQVSIYVFKVCVLHCKLEYHPKKRCSSDGHMRSTNLAIGWQLHVLCLVSCHSNLWPAASSFRLWRALVIIIEFWSPATCNRWQPRSRSCP